MDVQAQVAARRAELEEKARRAQTADAEEARSRQIAEQARRQEALTAIAADLSTSEVEVIQQGEKLAIAHPPAPLLDLDGLRRSKVEKLIKDEARKMWSPGENWQVIGLITAGIFLLPWSWLLGLLVFVVGVARRWVLNDRYRAEVRRRYPRLIPVEQASTST